MHVKTESDGEPQNKSSEKKLSITLKGKFRVVSAQMRDVDTTTSQFHLAVVNGTRLAEWLNMASGRLDRPSRPVPVVDANAKSALPRCLPTSGAQCRSRDTKRRYQRP